MTATVLATAPSIPVPSIPVPAIPVPAIPAAAALGWWRAVWGARALRRAAVRLDAASNHLLDDVGLGGHPLARRYDRDAERARAAGRIGTAGCW